MEKDQDTNPRRPPLGTPGRTVGRPKIGAGSGSAPSDRTARRAVRSRARFATALTLSLALHALLLAGFPGSGPSGRPWTRAAVRVRLTSGPYTLRAGAEPERTPLPGLPPTPALDAPPAPPKPGAQDPATPGSTAPELPAAPDSGSPLDTSYREPAPAGTDGPGEAGPPAAGEVRAPADAAAALLRARVEASLVYPEAARRRGTEGVVGLRIFLDGSGALLDLKIARSSGSAILDKAARETVAACLPVPNPGGKPLAFDLAVRFSLNKKAAAP